MTTQKKYISQNYKNLFSTEELDELKSAFSLFEENNNNQVEIAKVLSLFEALDSKNENIINMLIYLKGTAEENNNKYITFNDFLLGCENFLGKNTPENDLKDVYANFTDTNSSDSVITYESFKKMIVDVLGEELGDEELKFIFDVNSKNKGFLDLNDFTQIIQKSINNDSL